MKDWLEDENGLIEDTTDIESIELLHSDIFAGQIIPRLINEVSYLNLFVGGGYDNDDKHVILVDDLFRTGEAVQYIYIGRYNRYRDYCHDLSTWPCMSGTECTTRAAITTTRINGSSTTTTTTK